MSGQNDPAIHQVDVPDIPVDVPLFTEDVYQAQPADGYQQRGDVIEGSLTVVFDQ